MFPISSVGHGVIIPYLRHCNFNQQVFLPFMVMLHLGTALALLIYFWQDWYDFICSLFDTRSILPLVGTGLVLVPWAIWAAVSGNNLMAAELLGLMAVAAIVRHTLEPKVLGGEVGLSPLAILVIVYVGYDLMGLKGVFLGLVLGVAYKAIMTEERILADSEKERCSDVRK